MTETATNPNVAVWFDIPAADFERAVAFYEGLFETSLRRQGDGEMRMAVFPYEGTAVSGAVMAAPHLTPSPDGPVVYLNVDGRLDAVMARIPPLGGRLLGPKVELPGDMGAYVHAADTEGNRIGLHAAR